VRKTFVPGRAFLDRFDAAVAAEGFFAWGAAEAGPVADGARFEEWLQSGKNAGMDYLGRRPGLRLDPRRVLQGARSVLVFLRSYAWPAPPVPRGHVPVASYARGLDYHSSIKSSLKSLASRLEGARRRLFVDTGPVMEKYWARQAGLASIGKNSLCLRKDAGSLFFIGIILTDAVFPFAEREPEDICGTCRLCLEACPTGALTDPYVLDARNCLSYLTIEHSGPIAPGSGRYLKETLAGCDRCQEVCPYNRSPSVSGHSDFRPRPPLAAPSLADVLFWDDSIFASLSHRSALSRCGRSPFQRNALAAAAALGDHGLLERYLRQGADPFLKDFARNLLGKR